MKNLLRLLCLPLFALLLAGCTSKPVLNPQESFSTSQSEAEVHAAVLRGLKKRGWSVTAERAQLVQAKIVVRGRHGAEIDIPYSASNFSINYRNSFGMDYNNGKIHRNYNRWVNNLRATILQELQ